MLLSITNSEVITGTFAGKLASSSEEFKGLLEGQLDSGFLAEFTFRNETYKGLLIKMSPPSANSNQQTNSVSTNLHPSTDVASPSTTPAHTNTSQPDRSVTLPPLEDESKEEKKSKKTKKMPEKKKADSSSESDENKRKKTKIEEKKKPTTPTNGSKKDSESDDNEDKEKKKKGGYAKDIPIPIFDPVRTPGAFGAWMDFPNAVPPGTTQSQFMSYNLIQNYNRMNPPTWSNLTLSNSQSTKCTSCTQVLLYPAGETTVRCPACKAILDVKNSEQSVLRPCKGCATMLGNPSNALKVLCPLCKTTMDWADCKQPKELTPPKLEEAKSPQIQTIEDNHSEKSSTDLT